MNIEKIKIAKVDLQKWEECLRRTRTEIKCVASEVRMIKENAYDYQRGLSEKLNNLERIKKIAKKEIAELKEIIKEEELRQG